MLSIGFFILLFSVDIRAIVIGGPVNRLTTPVGWL